MERVKDVEGTVGMDGLRVLEVDEVYLVSGGLPWYQYRAKQNGLTNRNLL